MKLFALSIAISALLSSCNRHVDDIEIIMSPSSGYGNFMETRAISEPVEDSIFYSGVPNDLTEYVVRNFPLINKEISSITHDGVVNLFLEDVNDTLVDTDLLILIGTIDSNRRIIIVDSDNDEDFYQENRIEYNYPISNEQHKQGIDSFTVNAHYEIFFNGNILTDSTELLLSQHSGNIGIVFENEIENKYPLFVTFPEHRTGQISINGKKYTLHVSNGFVSPYYSIDDLSFFLTGENQPELTDELIPYSGGDIINLQGVDYKLSSISRNGDTITLKKHGNNIKPIGVNEQMYIPELTGLTADSSVFKLSDYQGKYILIEFWGTWCSPCVELIPELKKLKEKYHDENFEIVSIAYDNSIDIVREFIEDKEMNWVNVFDNRNTVEGNSLVDLLKISGFPTSFLVDPEGKILFRSNSLDKIEEYLEKNINTP